MQVIRTRVAGTRNVDVGARVDAAIEEIQAILNTIAVVRGTINNPNSDYFRFDSDNGKLYFESIEGTTYEVTMTEV